MATTTVMVCFLFAPRLRLRWFGLLPFRLLPLTRKPRRPIVFGEDTSYNAILLCSFLPHQAEFSLTTGEGLAPRFRRSYFLLILLTPFYVLTARMTLYASAGVEAKSLQASRLSSASASFGCILKSACSAFWSAVMSLMVDGSRVEVFVSGGSAGGLFSSSNGKISSAGGSSLTSYFRWCRMS